MTFRAVHAQWGPVFAHLPDLGCGRAWTSVWKARPRTPLACDECGHAMHAKRHQNGLRFFAHAPGAPNCELARESFAHHLLKLELASAARDAGAHAELEVRGPSGAWRADVLATAPGSGWQIALEAQLAPITAETITARTEAMRVDGVSACWFSDRPRAPWLGVVPSVRLERPNGPKPLTVVEGLAKFTGATWDTVPATLTEFLAWAFAGTVVPHTPRAGTRHPREPLAMVWTAPRYIHTEYQHLAEAEHQQTIREAEAEARRRAEGARRAEIHAEKAASQAKALREATEAELAARCKPAHARLLPLRAQSPEVGRAIALLADKHGITVSVGASTGDSRYADGMVLVDWAGVPAAVFDPKPERVGGDAIRLLTSVLLLFPTRLSRLRFQLATNTLSRPGVFHTDVLDDRPFA